MNLNENAAVGLGTGIIRLNMRRLKDWKAPINQGKDTQTAFKIHSSNF